MDTASSNPKFNWDSADLVGEWKAFRQHVEFTFKGPLRAMNEEARCCYLMLWAGEKGREYSPHGTCAYFNLCVVLLHVSRMLLVGLPA